MTSGQQQHVYFGNETCHSMHCTLPEELALLVFGFLPTTEVVHSISLVSLHWYHLAKSPALWNTLTFPLMTPKRAAKMGITSMARFIKLIERPQFASLKTLGFPNIYRTLNRNIYHKISKACPLLEHLDFVTGVRPFHDEMEKLPIIFPNLNGISLEVDDYRFKGKNECLSKFVKTMGPRLVRLHLSEDRHENPRDRCFDSILQSIGCHCPNLESFRYGFLEKTQEDEFEETVTGNGIISLLQGCSKLKGLELENLRKIGLHPFEYIINHHGEPFLDLKSLIVAGHPNLHKHHRLIQSLRGKLDTLKVFYYDSDHDE